MGSRSHIWYQQKLKNNHHVSRYGTCKPTQKNNGQIQNIENGYGGHLLMVGLILNTQPVASSGKLKLLSNYSNSLDSIIRLLPQKHNTEKTQYVIMVKFQFSNRKESQTHNIILNLLCPGPSVSIIYHSRMCVYNNFVGIYIVVNWNWSGTEMGCWIPHKIRIEFYLSGNEQDAAWSEDEYHPFFHTFLLDFLDCCCYWRWKLYEFNSFAIHSRCGRGELRCWVFYKRTFLWSCWWNLHKMFIIDTQTPAQYARSQLQQ